MNAEHCFDRRIRACFIDGNFLGLRILLVNPGLLLLLLLRDRDGMRMSHGYCREMRDRRRNKAAAAAAGAVADRKGRAVDAAR